MALHRDIYWIGRQWAVTGFGVQAIDQRLKGAFDIEASRLWEDGLTERMLALPWLNCADFDKALGVARTRFPEPPRKKVPLVDSILGWIKPASPEPSQPPAPRSGAGASSREPNKMGAMPALRAEGRLARFLPQWRVRR
jgi:hypothetical protein